MPPCIVAAVDTAGAGGVSASVAETDEVTDGAMRGVKPVCAALAADASDDDVLTSSGVAADNFGAGVEFWRKQNEMN